MIDDNMYKADTDVFPYMNIHANAQIKSIFCNCLQYSTAFGSPF